MLGRPGSPRELLDPPSTPQALLQGWPLGCLSWSVLVLINDLEPMSFGAKVLVDKLEELLFSLPPPLQLPDLLFSRVENGVTKSSNTVTSFHSFSPIKRLKSRPQIPGTADVLIEWDQ